MSLWIVILVLYKGLLMVERERKKKKKLDFYPIEIFQFYGSFLSWKTRTVQVPALNDSRYIGLSVYIVFICCTLGSLVIFIPTEQIQLSYILRAFFIVTCTTTTVCLVFVPKVNLAVWKESRRHFRSSRLLKSIMTPIRERNTAKSPIVFKTIRRKQKP